MMMPLIQKEQSSVDVKKTAAKIGVGLAVVCVVALVAVGTSQKKGTEVVSAKNMAETFAVTGDNWTSENSCRNYCYDTFYRKFYNYPNYLRCEQMCFYGKYSSWTPHSSSCMTTCHSASGNGDCHAICYPPLLMESPKKVGGEQVEETEEGEDAETEKATSVAVSKDNWTSENSCRNYCYDTFYRKFYNYPNYLRCEQMCFYGKYASWTPHSSACMTTCHSASGSGDCHAICYPPLLMTAPKKVGGEKKEKAEQSDVEKDAAKKMSAPAASVRSEKAKSVAVTGDNWTSENSCRSFCYDAFYRRNYNYPNYLQCEQMCFNGRYSHWAPRSSSCITVCHSVSGSGNCNTICTSS